MSSTGERTAHPDSALAAALRVAAAVIFVLAAAAVVLPGDLGRAFGSVMVALLIATPLARVAWLGVRWARARDWRFVALAVALLALTAVGALIAAATS